MNKRNNLKQVFDLKSSTSLHLGNEFSAYLQTFNKNFTVEVYTYKNPHKVSTSQIETVKEQLDINESTKNEGSSSAIPGPLFR